mmetsp:Transcript_65067/g.117057  ORF Transcript_65067/g.117057 Transcript_65067/m.117057 type:complete len:442 (-) Transcript_65067:1782-3107(-)
MTSSSRFSQRSVLARCQRWLRSWKFAKMLSGLSWVPLPASASSHPPPHFVPRGVPWGVPRGVCDRRLHTAGLALAQRRQNCTSCSSCSLCSWRRRSSSSSKCCRQLSCRSKSSRACSGVLLMDAPGSSEEEAQSAEDDGEVEGWKVHSLTSWRRTSSRKSRSFSRFRSSQASPRAKSDPGPRLGSARALPEGDTPRTLPLLLRAPSAAAPVQTALGEARCGESPPESTAQRPNGDGDNVRARPRWRSEQELSRVSMVRASLVPLWVPKLPLLLEDTLQSPLTSSCPASCPRTRRSCTSRWRSRRSSLCSAHARERSKAPSGPFGFGLLCMCMWTCDFPPVWTWTCWTKTWGGLGAPPGFSETTRTLGALRTSLVGGEPRERRGELLLRRDSKGGAREGVEELEGLEGQGCRGGGREGVEGWPQSWELWSMGPDWEPLQRRC